MPDKLTANVACECDYDYQGEEDGYVKTSRNCCPWHDSCTCCSDRPGRHKVDKEWLCGECKAEDDTVLAEAWNEYACGLDYSQQSLLQTALEDIVMHPFLAAVPTYSIGALMQPSTDSTKEACPQCSTPERARLNAAAPVLLEACKAIANLNSWDLGLPSEPTLTAKGAGAFALIRAAIEKSQA